MEGSYELVGSSEVVVDSAVLVWDSLELVEDSTELVDDSILEVWLVVVGSILVEVGEEDVILVEVVLGAEVVVEVTGGVYGARHVFLIKSRYVCPLLTFFVA